MPVVFSLETVYMNDTRLLYTGLGNSGDSWGDAAYYRTLCGGYRFTEKIGNTVSLSFNGTAVAVYILTDATHGGTGNVLIDGVLLQTLDTSNSAGSCGTVSATSSGLADGAHTIEVVQTSAGFLDMQSFTYTPSVLLLSSTSVFPSSSAGTSIGTTVPATTLGSISASASTSGPTAAATSAATGSSSKKSNGPIIGGVIGGVAILLLAGVLVYFMNRRRNKHRHVVDLDLTSFQATPWGGTDPYATLSGGHESKDPIITPNSAHESYPSFPASPSPNPQPKSLPGQVVIQEGQGSQTPGFDRNLLRNLIAHNVPAPAIARVIQMMGTEAPVMPGPAHDGHRPDAETDEAPPPTYDAKDRHAS
ncbi:hypothetical protein FRB95_009605 [Tulasnella sp. JGI-2019a]|nr:hypothetical protein FRB95_009605 [Tulasnella sp. JGI-2019a]